MDPLGVLRSGDRVERLVLQRLVERESRRRDTEMEASARAQAVLTGYMVALSLGVPWDVVAKVGEFVWRLGGEADVS